MKRGRKKLVALAYDFPGSDGEHSEELFLYHNLKRTGDLDMFHHNDPEWMMAKAEKNADAEEIRDQERQAAYGLANDIATRLTRRQQQIWRLHAEGRTFDEIASEMTCSIRTVYNDWKTVRQIAWECCEPKQ
jgi:DNA-directed RNA polymerase specialized sigma24 family protein